MVTSVWVFIKVFQQSDPFTSTKKEHKNNLSKLDESFTILVYQTRMQWYNQIVMILNAIKMLMKTTIKANEPAKMLAKIYMKNILLNMMKIPLIMLLMRNQKLRASNRTMWMAKHINVNERNITSKLSISLSEAIQPKSSRLFVLPIYTVILTKHKDGFISFLVGMKFSVVEWCMYFGVFKMVKNKLLN